MATAQASGEVSSIQSLWEEAEANFGKIANKSLKSRSKISLEDVRSKLDAKYGSSKTDSNAKVKRIGFNVINMIQTFGSFAAGVASSVFGPAQLCFSAISFLLEIPSKLEKLFGSIPTMFEALNDYLVRLEVYKRIEKTRELPHELLHSTSIILTSFVHMCGLAYGLAFGGKAIKFKSATLAILCNDDSGISDALKQFTDLVDKQTAVESSLNLEITANIDRNTQIIPEISSNVSEMRNEIRKIMGDGMETVIADVKNRSTDEVAAKQRAMLIKELEISKEELDEQERLFDAMRSDSLPESGSELEKDPSFLSWKDFTSDAKPALFLSGEPRSGKSFLVYAILEALKFKSVSSNEDDVPGARIVVAQYFFPKRDEKLPSTSTKMKTRNARPIITAIKHICLQIAQQHKVYAKELATLLAEPKLRGKSAENLWQELMIGRPRGDVVHALVFDGLDQISEEDWKTFFRIIQMQQETNDGSWTAAPNRSRVRILVSSTPEALPRDALLDVPVLDSLDLNTSNVHSFIEHDLNERKLWREETASTTSLVQFIKKSLPSRSGGDFSIIKQALESVRRVVEDGGGLEKAQKALIDACEQDQSTVGSKILGELSKSLSGPDATRLSHLMMWAIWGRARFDLKELRAAAFLESRDDPLQSFETVMTTKFARVFDIIQGQVFVKDNIEDYIRQKPGTRSQPTRGTDPSEPKISMEIKINNASVNQVRKFLWNLNERVNLETFLFESSDTQVDDQAIEAYALDALVYITNHCLGLLNDDRNEITEPLFPHAYLYINEYLRVCFNEAEDGLLHPDEMRSILSGIIAVLTDTEILEQHFFFPKALLQTWLLDEAGHPDHIIHTWLTFDTAVELLDRRDLRRLKKLLDESKGPLSFYRPLAVMITNHWLHRDEMASNECFTFIDGYLDQEILRQPFKEESTTPPINRTPSYSSSTNFILGPKMPRLSKGQRVARALEWAHNNLPKWEESDLTFQRLGETYWLLGMDEAAIEAYEAGKRFASDNWLLYTKCAAAHAGLKHMQQAMTEMEKGLRIVRNQPGVDLKTKSGYSFNVRKLMGWYIETKRYKKAIKEGRTALETNDRQGMMVVLLLKAMRLAGDFSGIKEYFMVTLAEVSPETGVSNLSALLRFLIIAWMKDAQDRHLDYLMICARDAGVIPYLLEAMRKCQQATSVKENDDILYCARRFLEANCLAYMCPASDAANLDLAIEIGEELIRKSNMVEAYEDGEDPHFNIIVGAHQVLAISYHRRMLNAIKADQIPEQYVTKLEAVIEQSRRKVSFFPDGTSNLAHYYCATNQTEKARDLIRPYLEEFLDMLVDDIPDNDMDALYYAAMALLLFGDEYNARVAWSLLKPFDQDVLDSPRSPTSQQSTSQDGVSVDGQNATNVEKNPSETALPNNSESGGKNDDSKVPNGHPQRQNSAKIYDVAVGDISSEDSDEEVQTDDEAPEPKVNDFRALVERNLIKIKLDTASPATGIDQVHDSGEQQVHSDATSNATSDTKSEAASDDDDEKEDIPIWYRASRNHLSLQIPIGKGWDWQFDPDNEDFILIQQNITLQEQEKMFAETRRMQDKQNALLKQCAGDCGKEWTFGSDVNVCRYCRFVLLCGPCLDHLKNGTGEEIIGCGPDHEWLHIPRWSNQRYKEVGKDHVRVDGEIDADGYITGGRIVPFQEWLGNIRKEWGITTVEADQRSVGKTSDTESDAASDEE